MFKLRLVFILIFVSTICIPLYQYFNLSKQRDLFVEASQKRSQYSQTIIAPRKTIVDRNQNELAISIKRPTLIFKSEVDKDRILEFSSNKSKDIFLSTNKRLYFESNIDQKFIDEAEIICSCIIIREDLYRRYYPYGSIAATVVGFSGPDGGLDGVEAIYNSSLQGDIKEDFFVRSAKGQKTLGDLETYIQKDEVLQLTIDITLQYKLFEELKNAIVDSKALGGFAVIMDAKNGDVLAMASYPSYNPNNSSRVLKRNRLISDFNEPGSLIKPFTIAGALDYGLIDKNTIIDTNPGYITLSNIQRSEAGGKNFGEIQPDEIIFYSSQVGTAKIAIKFSDDQLKSNLRRFGFGEFLRMDLSLTNPGTILDAQKLYDIDKASMGYGYSVEANSLQIARAYSVFANRGTMVEPRLSLSDEFERVQVLDPEIANYILNSLRDTVLIGTASSLSENIVEITGKTGTTNKFIQGEGYAEGRYQSSFASIFPHKDPQYIMIVTIDEPDPNKYFGGDVSAPVVGKMADFMLRLNYL